MVGPTEKVEFYGHPIVYIAPSVYGHPHVNAHWSLTLLNTQTTSRFSIFNYFIWICIGSDRTLPKLYELHQACPRSGWCSVSRLSSAFGRLCWVPQAHPSGNFNKMTERNKTSILFWVECRLLMSTRKEMVVNYWGDSIFIQEITKGTVRVVKCKTSIYISILFSQLWRNHIMNIYTKESNINYRQLFH